MWNFKLKLFNLLEFIVCNCKDIGIWKSEFAPKIQFLSGCINNAV